MDAARRDALEETRGSLKKHVKQTTDRQASVQMREVSFFSYMPALIVALMKDISDLFLGWIPGIGMILSMCFSLLIFFLLMMAGSQQKYSLTKKGQLLIGGAIIEGMPFLNILPLQTMLVFFIYRKDKKASQTGVTLQA